MTVSITSVANAAHLVLWLISFGGLAAGFTLGFVLDPQWYRLLWVGFGLVPVGLCFAPVLEWFYARKALDEFE